MLLEIPPVNECDFSWITEINKLGTTKTCDDSAEHTFQLVDISDSVIHTRFSVGFPITYSVHFIFYCSTNIKRKEVGAEAEERTAAEEVCWFTKWLLVTMAVWSNDKIGEIS